MYTDYSLEMFQILNDRQALKCLQTKGKGKPKADLTSCPYEEEYDSSCQVQEPGIKTWISCGSRNILLRFNVLWKTPGSSLIFHFQGVSFFGLLYKNRLVLMHATKVKHESQHLPKNIASSTGCTMHCTQLLQSLDSVCCLQWNSCSPIIPQIKGSHGSPLKNKPGKYDLPYYLTYLT